MLKNQRDRKILFCVDEKGGSGKSYLCKWLITKLGAWACQGGKIADLMHAYKPEADYAIFDMARYNETKYYPWGFMENLKNGWFTSTKYDGGMKVFKAPKILVLMNSQPPREVFSSDRYEIFVTPNNCKQM